MLRCQICGSPYEDRGDKSNACKECAEAYGMTGRLQGPTQYMQATMAQQAEEIKRLCAEVKRLTQTKEVIMPRAVKLIFPDENRCQVEIQGGSFMTIGPRHYERCNNKPVVVVTERKRGPDGQCGSMSMCAACLAVFKKSMPIEDYFILTLDEYLTNKKVPPMPFGRVAVAAIDAATKVINDGIVDLRLSVDPAGLREVPITEDNKERHVVGTMALPEEVWAHIAALAGAVPEGEFFKLYPTIKYADGREQVTSIRLVMR
jgi:hypothetical protein